MVLKHLRFNGVEQPIRDSVRIFDFVNLFEDDTLGLFERLVSTLSHIEIRHTDNHNFTIATANIRIAVSSRNCIIEHKFIEETYAMIVVKQRESESEGEFIFITFFHAIINPSYLRLVTDFGFVNRVTFVARSIIFSASRNFFSFEATEFFSDNRFYSLCIEITNEHKAHVIRHIPSVEEVDKL